MTTVGSGKTEDWKGCIVDDTVTEIQRKFGTIWTRDFMCGDWVSQGTRGIMNSQNVTWPRVHKFCLLWNSYRILLKCYYFGDSEERNWRLQEGWETTTPTGRLCTGSRDKFKNHRFLVKISCGCSEMEIWHPQYGRRRCPMGKRPWPPKRMPLATV